jgi:hypothetical protein
MTHKNIDAHCMELGSVVCLFHDHNIEILPLVSLNSQWKFDIIKKKLSDAKQSLVNRISG